MPADIATCHGRRQAGGRDLISKNKARSTEADASLGRIGPVVRASFSETQRDAIRAAFDEPGRVRRRAINLGGEVPMFFTGFYFVFLAGRDRRHQERKNARRGVLSVAGGVVLLLVSLVPVLLVVLGVLFILCAVFGVRIAAGDWIRSRLGSSRPRDPSGTFPTA